MSHLLRVIASESYGLCSYARTRQPTGSVPIGAYGENWTRTEIPTSMGQLSKEFLLKWADLKKARAKFAAGIKQAISVRRYTEFFEDLILEANFHDPTMLASTF